MKKILILIGVILCLGGPTTVYTMVGRQVMRDLGKRPTFSARTMLRLLAKLTITAGTVIGVLIGLLHFFTK